jgi:uncharacterized membrane protein YcaP (DUF421 family)
VLGLGLPIDQLQVHHAVARAVVVYLITLLFVRLAGKRLVERSSAFDWVVAIVLGSVAGRAISGTAPFGPTIAACATLIAVDWLLSFATARSPRIAAFTEGRAETLLHEGKLDLRRMRRARVSLADLESACRESHLPGVEDAERIVLETTGRLTVLPRSGASR